MALSYPELNGITHEIIGAAIEVHSHLRAGLYESSYHRALSWELTDRRMAFELECPIPMRYKSRSIDCAYRADMIVEKRVLVEIKAIEKVVPIHKTQVLTYLSMSQLHVGLLINFNVEKILDGITRISL